MILYYPHDFTSTQTFQNSIFTFPHDAALSLSVKDAEKHFYRENYILPAYIKYLGHDYDYNVLKTPEMAILGVAFMKLKSLEEKLDFLFTEAFKYKQTHLNKYQEQIDQYITMAYYEDMLVMVGRLTTIVQLMIINYIDAVGHHHDFVIDDDVLTLLDKFNHIQMIEIPVSITLYLTRVIPILVELYDFDYNIV